MWKSRQIIDVCKVILMKLIVFDMDGVLTKEKSSWNYVHRALGVDNSKNFDLYRSGRISYSEFFDRDIELWLKKYGKISRERIIEILKRIELQDNIDQLICFLKECNAVTAIVSGGIYWLAEIINDRLKFNEIYANDIMTDDHGYIIKKGKIMVDPMKKGDVIKLIEEKHCIKPDDAIAIGDSYSDISMKTACSKFISFNGDELINSMSDYSAKSMLDLIDILNKI